MATKHGKHARSTATAPDLHARVERALNDQRFQNALELAKQLYKSEPTPANADLLCKVSLGRARQLRSQGYSRDALVILNNAKALPLQNVALKREIAQELAACGDEIGRAHV